MTIGLDTWVGASVAVGGHRVGVTDVPNGRGGVSASGTGVAVGGVGDGVGEAQPVARTMTTSKAHDTRCMILPPQHSYPLPTAWVNYRN